MVPNGWKKSTVGSIAKVTSGGTPSRKNDSYWNGDIPWVTTSEVKFGVIVDTEQKITKQGLDNSSAKLFPKDTILMAMYGQGKTRGQVAKLGIEASTNQACAALLLNKEHDVEYYYHYLISQYDNIRELANSGGQQNLSAGIIKDISVPVPPLPEQRKIAQILSTWDRAIATTEKLIDASKQQKKALMQQLLTGKKRLIDPETGKAFEGEWEEVKFSSFGKCIRGVSYKPTQISKNENENTIRLLRSTNIQEGKLNDKDLVILPREVVKPAQLMIKNDLAICMANGSKLLVGKSAPFNGNERAYTVGAFCAIFRPTKTYSHSLVQHVFNSAQYRHQLKVILAGSAINNLKGSDIESMVITLPVNIEEQQKIASVLTAADKEIELLEAKLSHFKQEKKALMQQLLTGKRRVKVPETEAS